MGVFLFVHRLFSFSPGLPHVRGGVSARGTAERLYVESSPRAWGCFQPGRSPSSATGVFPTCVGVFLAPLGPIPIPARLPHVRGGVSRTASRVSGAWSSSPRAWGCFYPPPSVAKMYRVFPTCVGVFRKARAAAAQKVGLPHVRGGVSVPRSISPASPRSSPRAWGCFP